MAAMPTSAMHKECKGRKGRLAISPLCSGEFSADIDACGSHCSQTLEAMAGELEVVGAKALELEYLALVR